MNAPRNKDWQGHANEHWKLMPKPKSDKQPPNFQKLALEYVFGPSVQENPSINKVVSGKHF